MWNPFSANRKKCPYCGANQTLSHRLSRIESTITVMTTAMQERFLHSRISAFGFALGEALIAGLLSICVFLRVITFSNDISKAPIKRGRVLWEEAVRRGIEMQNLKFLWMTTDLFRVRINKDKGWLYFSGLPRARGADNPALAWMDDKFILKQRLREAGIPVPHGGSFSDYASLEKMFSVLDKPVIIKPRLGSRGRHTTTFLYEPTDLKKAYQIAKRLCRYVIMEEHIVGSVYRGTIIDGVARGVLGGDPPRVTGDGIHTIRELARTKNEMRDSSVKDIPINDMTNTFLMRQGYTLETILPKGITIDLSEKIGVSYGGSSAEVTETTHPKIISYLEKAAKVVDDPILGFDFIIDDITKDPDTQKWGIIECNALPFINLHHDPLIGTPKNIAGYVWEYIERVESKEKR